MVDKAEAENILFSQVTNTTMKKAKVIFQSDVRKQTGKSIANWFALWTKNYTIPRRLFSPLLTLSQPNVKHDAERYVRTSFFSDLRVHICTRMQKKPTTDDV